MRKLSDMRKPFLVLIAVVAIGGGLFYFSKENTSDSMSDSLTKAVPKEGEPTPSPVTEGLADVLKPYSPAALATATEKGRTVLFFSAAWCPTCKSAKQDISRNFTKLPKDLTILDLDYDTEKDLKKKYGITTQHTLVQVDTDGSEITKWIGGGVATILSNVEPI